MGLIMRQVPRYLLIGNGRVARHMAQYFSLLNLSFQSWNRSQSHAELNAKLEDATHVLILISDKAIQSFADTYLKNHHGIHIHCSGSLISPTVFGAHPLQTFNQDGVYTLDAYQAIPFILEEEAPAFQTLLPELTNPHARIHKKDKAKYHALCVMSGNFTCMLWQKLFHEFENDFNIPKTMAFEFLQRQAQNLIIDSTRALTGPLVRNDRETINKHLDVLNQDEYQSVYQSFVDCYEKLKMKGVV